MKKRIIFSVVALVLLYISLPKYEFTHYKLPAENIYVTKVEYRSIISGNSTYFTTGKYRKRSIPESFVRPIYSGISGGYGVMVSLENRRINIYCFNSYFETHNLSNINFEELSSDSYGVKKWKQMVNDSTGKYIHMFF